MKRELYRLYYLIFRPLAASRIETMLDKKRAPGNPIEIYTYQIRRPDGKGSTVFISQKQAEDAMAKHLEKARTDLLFWEQCTIEKRIEVVDENAYRKVQVERVRT